VVELTVALAREMLAGAGMDDVDPADRLADGSAMDVWRRMIAAQGGDPDAELPRAAHTHTVTAERAGRLERLDALAVGVAAWRLGADGPARRTRCRPAPVCRCMPSPATPSGPGSRC
jgi:thymidine phosphorylase